MAGSLSGDTTVFSNVSLYDGRLAASRVTSSGTIIASEVWSSGFSALGSIGTFSRVSSAASVVAVDVWGSTVSGGFLARAGTASVPTFAFGGDPSIGWYRSAASTIALSQGTLNLRAGRVSVASRADATGMSIGELAVVFAASGVSLIFSSGASYYIIGGSATSAAQS